MSIVDGGAGLPKPLVERVKGILLKPNEEWDRIDPEPATIKGLYTGYACILAAIPAVSAFIGEQVFGVSLLGIHYRPPLVGSLVSAIVNYALSLAMLYVLALIVEALAPTFNGIKDRTQAFKLAAYSGTAMWVAGVFALIPMLMPLMILGGLYSLFLLYLGLPKLMKSPQEKALSYTAVTIVVAIVLSIVVRSLTGAVTGGAMLGGGFARNAPSAAGGEISIGGTKVDLGKLEQASKQMEATAKQLEAQASGAAAGTAGAVQAVPGETLKALLPEVGGYTRSEISSESGGVGGFNGSKAEARYEKGPSNITVEIMDLGAAGGIAGAFQVQSNKETATGYEKVSTVDGRITTEEYDRTSKSGKYGVMVGSRFMVEARGDQVAINDLKSVVGAVDMGQLERLAK